MAILSIAQILSASAITIANPSKSVLDELGISKVDAGLLILATEWFVAKKAYDWIKNKINGNQEKERMYREIIAKQQAAVTAPPPTARSTKTSLTRQRHNSLSTRWTRLTKTLLP